MITDFRTWTLSPQRNLFKQAATLQALNKNIEVSLVVIKTGLGILDF